MSISQSPSYTVHDFLTRMVPGGIATLAVYFGVGGPLDLLTQLSPFSLLLLVTIFYVVGEIIEYGRVRIMPVPKYFGRVLFECTGEYAVLTPSDKFRYHIFVKPKQWLDGIFDRDFQIPDYGYDSVFQDADLDPWNSMRSRYGFKWDYTDSKRIYKVLHTDLDQSLSSGTQRIQRTYVFFQNMKIASILGILFALSTSFSEGSETTLRGAALLLLFGIILLYSVTYFAAVDEEYVDSLMIEFLKEVNAE